MSSDMLTQILFFLTFIKKVLVPSDVPKYSRMDQVKFVEYSL